MAKRTRNHPIKNGAKFQTIFLTMVLIFALAVSLAGCGNNKNDVNATPDEQREIDKALNDDKAIENLPDVQVFDGRYEVNDANYSGPLTWLVFGPNDAIETSSNGTGKYKIEGEKLTIQYDNSAYTTYEIQGTQDPNTITLDGFPFTYVGSSETTASEEPTRPADFSGTVSIETLDGYTLEITYSLYNPIVTVDTANAKPGEANLNVIVPAGTLTVKNTTAGHNLDSSQAIRAYVAYPFSELETWQFSSWESTSHDSELIQEERYLQPAYASHPTGNDITIAPGDEHVFDIESGSGTFVNVPEGVANELAAYMAENARYHILTPFYGGIMPLIEK